ncbi:uncharacterized protein BP5553_00958 [Venustampulla echinocandica]|uniref:Uncharacterized protein n=1 Tax=Venustampulla echinocandica TaxID=2656787 RepID=A0A370TZM0_9HELO|nr:uncharacterized protein BP5553_00958 [Venustampulla echinocandica]RDL40979.1 hypothetical protein BP5553_00958 [Venustampulla echinocandica]
MAAEHQPQPNPRSHVEENAPPSYESNFSYDSRNPTESDRDATQQKTNLNTTASPSLSPLSKADDPPAYSSPHHSSSSSRIPLTLTLDFPACAIYSSNDPTQALYNLSQPLSIKPHAIKISDGRGQIIYRVYEYMELPHNFRSKNVGAAVISPQRGSVDVEKFIVRRKAKTKWLRAGPSAATGGSEGWEVCGEEKEILEFSATPQVSGGGDEAMKWMDSERSLVAVDVRKQAAGGNVVLELEILTQLKNEILELLVAAWVSRVWREGRDDQEEDLKRKKEEIKQREREVGGLKGRLGEVKEALGIGYGIKPGPRSAGMYTGPPSIGDNGRIKWS